MTAVLSGKAAMHVSILDKAILWFCSLNKSFMESLAVSRSRSIVMNPDALFICFEIMVYYELINICTGICVCVCVRSCAGITFTRVSATCFLHALDHISQYNPWNTAHITFRSVISQKNERRHGVIEKQICVNVRPGEKFMNSNAIPCPFSYKSIILHHANIIRVWSKRSWSSSILLEEESASMFIKKKAQLS